MAYRKRRTTRRKRTTRRRFTKRTRTSRRSGQKIHVFKRHVDRGVEIIDAVTGLSYGVNFSLNDVPGSSEFTSLYDMYKINAVKITFIPQMTEIVNSTGSGNPFNSRIISAIDKNDDTAPITADELRQFKTCKVTNITRQHRRYIYKPQILDSSSYSISPWMSTASPGTNYYGLKLWAEPTGITGISTVFQLRIECVYYMSFKNVK